jgi:hypothetical protein
MKILRCIQIYHVIIGVSWLAVNGFVITHAEDWDNCYEYWNDEYAKTEVLHWYNAYIFVKEWDIEIEVWDSLEGDYSPYESHY